MIVAARRETMSQNIQTAVSEITEPILQELGMELVDIEYKKKKVKTGFYVCSSTIQTELDSMNVAS